MDSALVISKMYDLIIKTIITAESTVVSLVRKYNLSRNNCFDLFGFDILLDSNLKPWLLEVNLSPSLATDSPLDLFIKGNLVSELFNLVGVRNYDRRAETVKNLRLKHKTLRPHTAKVPEADDKFAEVFKDTIEEFLRTEHFVRIYPCEGSEIYDKFFNIPRKINKALFHFLFESNNIQPSLANTIVITGEDLLIEYISRIISLCEQISLDEKWKTALKDFVNHEILIKNGFKTYSSDVDNQLMEILIELKQRNAKLRKDQENSDQKAKIIQKFTSSEIENILKTTKNELNTIVSCFFIDSVGILSAIQTKVSQTPKRAYLDLKFVLSKTRENQ